MLRSLLWASLHCALGNRRLLRTSTVVSRKSSFIVVCQTASVYQASALGKCSANPDRPPIPRVPRIEKLSQFSTMGIRLSTCIIALERIFRWERTRRSHERFSRQKWGRLWRWRKSVGYTTATNDGLPEKAKPIRATRWISLGLRNLRPNRLRHVRTSVNFGFSFINSGRPRAD